MAPLRRMGASKSPSYSVDESFRTKLIRDLLILDDLGREGGDLPKDDVVRPQKSP